MRPGLTILIRKRNNRACSGSTPHHLQWSSFARSSQFTDYLEQGKTVTGVYYAGLIRKLREVIKQKRCGKLTQGVLLHHDNAPAHSSHVAMTTVLDCFFELLSHPPYSPDLAPSDFHLFRHLKESLCGRAFEDDEAVTMAVNEWIEDRHQNFFLEGVKNIGTEMGNLCCSPRKLC